MSAFNSEWRTCYRCNYDLHICPGCGEPLPHHVVVCAACDADDRPDPKEIDDHVR